MIFFSLASKAISRVVQPVYKAIRTRLVFELDDLDWQRIDLLTPEKWEVHKWVAICTRQDGGTDVLLSPGWFCFEASLRV
jgi:hypothetical protein